MSVGGWTIRERDLLAPFLRPRGIVLAAGPSTPRGVACAQARSLLHWGYTGEVVLTGRGACETEGVSDIEAAAMCDVALVTAVADEVVEALDEVSGWGISNAVVLAPGFEGEPGATRRASLAGFLADHPNLRLIGPNCAGAMSATDRTILNLAAPSIPDGPVTGKAALVVQSGGVGISIAQALLRRGAGLAHCISTGDELDLGAIRVATELLARDECAAVGLFVEGITDAGELPALQAAIERTGKPVVALRAGGSVAGRLAAFGHTGRVIGDAVVARAALEQAGVRLLSSIEELCDVLTVLSVIPARGCRGRARVGVLVGSGGVGVVAADEAARCGNLDLPPLGMEPNPRDLPSLGDRGLFARAVGELAVGDGIDAVVAVVTSLAHDLELLSRLAAPAVPTVIASQSPDERFSDAQIARLAGSGIVAVPSVQNAIRALSAWAGGERAGPPAAAPAHGGTRLGIVRTAERLPGLAQWLSPTSVVRSGAAAAAEAARLGTPIVVKAEGTVVAHRLELGVVELGCASPQAASVAYERVAGGCAVLGEDVVVQPMAAPGIELFVAALRDPELGPVVLCRPGGELVELGADSSVLTPIRENWGRTLAGSTTGRLLAGYRGKPPADLEGFLALAGRLLDLLGEDAEIDVIECNPVIVHPVEREHGMAAATIVDVSTLVRERP